MTRLRINWLAVTVYIITPAITYFLLAQHVFFAVRMTTVLASLVIPFVLFSKGLQD